MLSIIGGHIKERPALDVDTWQKTGKYVDQISRVQTTVPSMVEPYQIASTTIHIPVTARVRVITKLANLPRRGLVVKS